MIPGDDDDRGKFRRNVIIFAALHIAAIAGIWGFSLWKQAANPVDNIAWLDGGGSPVGGQDAQATPAPADDAPASEDTPAPTPEPEQMATAAPTAQENAPPSQIVIPTPTVRPTLEALPSATPTPEATATPTLKPKLTPTPTPKPKPKPSPKPSPKASPKPKPKPSASPKKHASPKPSPHKTPADDANAEGDDSTPAPSAKPGAKKSAGHSTAGGSGEAGTAPGTGGGHRGGNGHAGGGNTQGDFGWYTQKLQKTFTDGWDQPTSIVTATTQFSSIIKISIERDGTISDVSLSTSSGNEVMDKSVMEAARKITHVDALPDGLGDGGAYEVRIKFDLTQQSQ